MEKKCKYCKHRGQETMADVGSCNLCEDHDFSQLDPLLTARWKGEGFGDYRCSLCDTVVSGKPERCPCCHSFMEV